MFPWQGGNADPKETVREWKRQLKSQQRALDKQIRGVFSHSTPLSNVDRLI